MRIKNLASTTVYMGYEAPGFYLKAGAVSEELPYSYLNNQCLQADAEAGRIEVMEIKKETKISAPAREPERTAPEPTPVLKVEPKPVTPPTKSPLNADIAGKVDRIAKPEDKKEYLMDRITKGDGPTAKEAADVLVDLTRKQAEETKTRPAEELQGKPAKPYSTMTKIELVPYALSLGIVFSPTIDINPLRKLVGDKLKEKGGN